jgi:hypothetical protein
MNDQEFEKLLAAEYARPLARDQAAELVHRVLTRADQARRTKQAVVAAAAAAGVATAIGITAAFTSLEAAVRGFAELFAAGPALAPAAVLSLALTLVGGVRARVGSGR